MGAPSPRACSPAAGVSRPWGACLLQAEEFDALEEDDQYTYLEELAPRMTKMCATPRAATAPALRPAAAVSPRPTSTALDHLLRGRTGICSA